LLIDLSLLVVHLFLVLLSLEQNLILVLLLNFLNSGKEVLVLALFLRLQFGESFGFLEHALGVLVALLLNRVLLLVEELSALHLHCALRLIDLSQERLLLVLGLLALGHQLGLFLGNSALLGLHVELDVDLHVSLLLVLVLSLELILFRLERLDLIFVTKNLLAELKRT